MNIRLALRLSLSGKRSAKRMEVFMRSRNYFTPFCPDVPFTQLPDLIKPRRNVDEAAEILRDGHAAILRVVEFALLSSVSVILIIAAGAQVSA